MAPMTSGPLSATLTSRRRDMSMSSGFGPSSTVTVRGSKAMPQMGQDPGWSCTISGCIGQVYSAPATATWGADGLGPRYLAGSAWNRFTQLRPQK